MSFTAAALKSSPLWNLMPVRSLNVHSVKSALCSKDFARNGLQTEVTAQTTQAAAQAAGSATKATETLADATETLAEQQTKLTHMANVMSSEQMQQATAAANAEKSG